MPAPGTSPSCYNFMTYMKRIVLPVIILLLLIYGCAVKPNRVLTNADKDYQDLKWKYYQDSSGFGFYYPPEWKLMHGGKNYIQLINFDINNENPAEQFSGEMAKTEIHWQLLSDQDFEFYPEVTKVRGGFTFRQSNFLMELNGLMAERWTGADILRQARKITVYDSNAVRETDLTTQFITRNTLYVIDTYTSGEGDKVPTDQIRLLHNSFSF